MELTETETKPKARAPKREMIRTKFPKIRIVQRASGTFYQVDARKRGTDGTQEHFPTKDRAVTRAREIAGELNANGFEGLAMPADLRAMAFAGRAMLEQFGKTILQACEHYRAYLLGEKQKDESAIVSILADAWLEAKKKDGFPVSRGG